MGDQAISQAIVVAQDSLNPGTSIDKLALFNEDGTPFTPSGGSALGSPVIHAIPFAFDTPNLDTGAPLYTPTPGDVLLDVWMIIIEEFDNATEFANTYGDIGFFLAAQTGFYYDLLNNGLGVILDPASGILLTAADGSVAMLGATVGAELLPAIFGTDDLICVVVSNDGVPNPGAPAAVTSDVAIDFPLTIATGVNNQVAGSLGGNPEIYTTAADGTYDTIDDLVTALNLQFGGRVNASDAGDNLLTLTVRDGTKGYQGNGYTIEDWESNAGATALGFTSDPATFGGGYSGEAGSTQGSGVLYVVTATPVSP